MRRPRHGKTLVLLVAGLCVAATAAAQRGRFGYRLPPNPAYDGGFMFCRIMFRQASNGDGGGWAVDYPRADMNLPYRLSELTLTPVSRDAKGNFNHAVLRLTDSELYHCPFIMMTEVGALYMDEEEAAHLKDYLLKGGFLWADDFWGEYAWRIWENAIRQSLPAGEYPIVDLPHAHPLFHMLYQVNSVPQIPSINAWFELGGGTSERGVDSAVPHARAIFDARGNIMVLITHNTDFGDAFEREGDNRAYFERFAGVGYAFGINALLYSMTH
jgi:hypothetical protein